MPQPKKIIILGSAHPLRPGGITTFNERLCKAFISSGHQCTIWSFSLQYPAMFFPGSSQFTTSPAPVGIPIVSLINSINPINWFKVGFRLKKNRPDIIVVRYWIPFLGPCLGTILRIAKNPYTRIVCIADNVVPHELRPFDRLFTQYFVQPVNRFIVMSKTVQKELKHFTQKPVSLLPHPLYDNFGSIVTCENAREILIKKFNLKINTTEPLLVFFGLVRHYKGLDILIDALTLIKNTAVKLLVAGEFYEKESIYIKQIEKNGLGERIILHNNFIADNDVKYFICAADCIIQPYREATQSGVTPVAYHFEIPMIITNVGGLPEMVPNGKAGLVAAPTANGLAEAIDDYFGKGKECFLPGLLAEKSKLSWHTMVDSIIYNQK